MSKLAPTEVPDGGLSERNAERVCEYARLRVLGNIDATVSGLPA